MLQKLKKSSVDSTPVDLPPPPNVDQMFADLVKLRPNDPLLQLAAFDCFLADVGEKAAADGVSSGNDEIGQKLSKLASVCDDIRDAGELLGEKRLQLKSLARSAMEKRAELEGIVSWSAEDESTESDEETEGSASKSD